MLQPKSFTPALLSSLVLLMGNGSTLAQTPTSEPSAQPTLSPDSFSTTVPLLQQPVQNLPLQNENYFNQPLQDLTIQDEGYLIGPGDVLHLEIFDLPEHSHDYGVLPDGSLNLPQVGPVKISRMTLQQAAQTIEQKLASWLRRPNVTVSLVQARPLQVAIAGEVKRPGVYTLENLTALTQALQKAGGPTSLANLREVQVRRPLPQGQGQEQTITLNLVDLITAGNLNNDIVLRAGDSVFVPTATSVNLQELGGIATSTLGSLSSEPIRIAVVGEVKTPGPRILNDGIQTVTTAIQGAGGITQEADIRQIQIRRTSIAGETQTIAVDFWKLLKDGDLSQDLPVQDGDTVFVPTATTLSPEEMTRLASASFSPETMTVNVVGEVTGPGPVEVKPNTPLNQAILAAGGFTNRAKKGSVDLVRLNPDGTVTKRSIDIDLAQGLNTETNPALRPNDTIIVGRSGFARFQEGLSTFLSPITSGFSLFRILGF
jgi:polysaccharide export outer membrane protein